MSTIDIACACGRRFCTQVKERLTGEVIKNIKCPGCQSTLTGAVAQALAEKRRQRVQERRSASVRGGGIAGVAERRSGDSGG